jgi:hypothetical protein
MAFGVQIVAFATERVAKLLTVTSVAGLRFVNGSYQTGVNDGNSFLVYTTTEVDQKLTGTTQAISNTDKTVAGLQKTIELLKNNIKLLSDTNDALTKRVDALEKHISEGR